MLDHRIRVRGYAVRTRLLIAGDICGVLDVVRRRGVRDGGRIHDVVGRASGDLIPLDRESRVALVINFVPGGHLLRKPLIRVDLDAVLVEGMSTARVNRVSVDDIGKISVIWSVDLRLPLRCRRDIAR